MAKRYVKEKGLVRAVTTNNLELEKPLSSDNYDIEVHNRNMDKIDSSIQEVKGKIDGLELVASKVTMTNGTTVENNIIALQNELGINKTTLEVNINAIRGVL